MESSPLLKCPILALQYHSALYPVILIQMGNKGKLAVQWWNDKAGMYAAKLIRLFPGEYP